MFEGPGGDVAPRRGPAGPMEVGAVILLLVGGFGWFGYWRTGGGIG